MFNVMLDGLGSGVLLGHPKHIKLVLTVTR